MRFFLRPVACGVSVIDVVTVGVRLPRTKVGSFRSIASIIPVFLETDLSGDPERTNDFSLAAIFGAATAKDKVALLGGLSYFRFAGG